MKKYKNIKDKFGILICIAIYAIFIHVTHIGCPIKWFTGVPCPGCGMTRSCIAFLHLDFKSAFEYHALTILAVPSFLYIILGKRPLFKSYKNEKVFYAILIIAMLGYYIIRLFIVKNTIICIDISNSFMVRLIKIFKELFT